MSGLELKPCPFCGAELIIGKQRIASCKTEGCAVQHRGVDMDYPKHIAAWNRRTPDPAQIRADALREAMKTIIPLVILSSFERQRIKAAILALIDLPLSPTAVDNSPAPDAGGKEDK